MNSKIDDFIGVMVEDMDKMNFRTHWPLSSGQIGAYFDVDEALDIYNRIQKLRKEGLTAKEIGKMLPHTDIFRNFMTNNGLVGLKVARKLNLAKISREELIDYVYFLFEILENQIQSDIFCLDGKNHYLTKEQVKKFADSLQWDTPKNKKQIGILNAMANNFCYTLFYDVYMVGGFILHGPYDVSEKFGEDTILIAREYHDLNPKELWPNLEMPFKKMQVYAVYKNLDLKMNFINHPVTTDSIADKLVAFKIFLDGKPISEDKIPGLIELFSKKAQEQSKKIREKSDLDKVRKGAEIAFYLFKDFRKAMGDDWIPENYIEVVIEKFGDEFLRKFDYKSKGSPKKDYWIKLFDPRIDSLGFD
jgi:hypothetical protein